MARYTFPVMRRRARVKIKIAFSFVEFHMYYIQIKRVICINNCNCM